MGEMGKIGRCADVPMCQLGKGGIIGRCADVAIGEWGNNWLMCRLGNGGKLVDVPICRCGNWGRGEMCSPRRMQIGKYANYSKCILDNLWA